MMGPGRRAKGAGEVGAEAAEVVEVAQEVSGVEADEAVLEVVVDGDEDVVVHEVVDAEAVEVVKSSTLCTNQNPLIVFKISKLMKKMKRRHGTILLFTMALKITQVFNPCPGRR
jgi:hypothetical protein